MMNVSAKIKHVIVDNENRECDYKDCAMIL